MPYLMKICLYLVYTFWKKIFFSRKRVESYEILALYDKVKLIQDDA